MPPLALIWSSIQGMKFRIFVKTLVAAWRIKLSIFCHANVFRTRCLILGSMRLHCVSKKLTPRRMLKKISKMRKKSIFLVKGSATENFNMNFFWNGDYRNRHVMDSAIRISIWKGGTKLFWPCFGCPKSVEGDKMQNAQKYEVLQTNVSSKVFKIELVHLNDFFP